MFSKTILQYEFVFLKVVIVIISSSYVKLVIVIRYIVAIASETHLK